MNGKNKFVGDTITVKELIDNYGKLGIPHFQRGQVWTDENKSALPFEETDSAPIG